MMPSTALPLELWSLVTDFIPDDKDFVESILSWGCTCHAVRNALRGEGRPIELWCQFVYSGDNLTSSQLRFLIAIGPRLQSLQLEADEDIKPRDLPLSDVFCGLGRCQNLRHLNLRSQFNVDDAVLIILAGATQLVSLSIQGCAITDKGLAHLVNLPRLESLELGHHDQGNGQSVTDAGIGSLAVLQSLRSLQLACGHKLLKGLTLPRITQLVHLDLFEIYIPRSALRACHDEMPNLLWLNIAGCESAALTAVDIRHIVDQVCARSAALDDLG